MELVQTLIRPLPSGGRPPLRLPLLSRMKNIGHVIGRPSARPAPTRPPARPPADTPRLSAVRRLLPESRPRRLIQPATLSRTAHVSAAARRASLVHPSPPHAARPPGTFNRQRTLFCCSGVCYSRCPRRRARKSARSRLSCATLKAASVATYLQRLPRTPRKILNYHSAR